MSLALSTCILFISLMQPVNGAQYLIITFLLALFASAPVIVSLTSMYASL